MNHSISSIDKSVTLHIYLTQKQKRNIDLIFNPVNEPPYGIAIAENILLKDIKNITREWRSLADNQKKSLLSELESMNLLLYDWHPSQDEDPFNPKDNYDYSNLNWEDPISEMFERYLK